MNKSNRRSHRMQKWSCIVCTLINDYKVERCVACFSLKSSAEMSQEQAILFSSCSEDNNMKNGLDLLNNADDNNNKININKGFSDQMYENDIKKQNSSNKQIKQRKLTEYISSSSQDSNNLNRIIHNNNKNNKKDQKINYLYLDDDDNLNQSIQTNNTNMNRNSLNIENQNNANKNKPFMKLNEISKQEKNDVETISDDSEYEYDYIHNNSKKKRYCIVSKTNSIVKKELNIGINKEKEIRCKNNFNEPVNTIIHTNETSNFNQLKKNMDEESIKENPIKNFPCWNLLQKNVPIKLDSILMTPADNIQMKNDKLLDKSDQNIDKNLIEMDRSMENKEMFQSVPHTNSFPNFIITNNIEVKSLEPVTKRNNFNHIINENDQIFPCWNLLNKVDNEKAYNENNMISSSTECYNKDKLCKKKVDKVDSSHFPNTPSTDVTRNSSDEFCNRLNTQVFESGDKTKEKCHDPSLGSTSFPNLERLSQDYSFSGFDDEFQLCSDEELENKTNLSSTNALPTDEYNLDQTIENTDADDKAIYSHTRGFWVSNNDESISNDDEYNWTKKCSEVKKKVKVPDKSSSYGKSRSRNSSNVSNSLTSNRYYNPKLRRWITKKRKDTKKTTYKKFSKVSKASISRKTKDSKNNNQINEYNNYYQNDSIIDDDVSESIVWETF